MSTPSAPHPRPNPKPRPKQPTSRPVLISKKLSWLLRHGASSEHLPLGAGGYANLADVLANRNFRSLHVTLAEIRAVVRDDNKQRFSLIPASPPAISNPATITDTTTTPTGEGPHETPQAEADPASTLHEDPAAWLIRANQGHSVKVAHDGLLKAIVGAPQQGDDGGESDVPQVAVHGTTHRAWPMIVLSGGLKTMGRMHVHLAAGLPAGFKGGMGGGGGANGRGGNGGKIGEEGEEKEEQAETGERIAAPAVISGMRNSSTVLIYVDVARALAAGIKFWRSENGVILSEGDERGIIPLEFFQRVEDRSGEGVLVLDGKIVKDAPPGWSVKPTRKG